MKNVAFYGRLFSDYGLNPLKMQAPEDITVLPYLTKETVRKRLDEFIDLSVPKESLIKNCTSGSTGMALTVYKDRKALALYQAFLSDSLSRIGYTLKSKEVRFLHDLRVGSRKYPPFIKNGGRLTFSGRHLSE
jgi:phenylacetate-coenzyme A ligase PaaK-like adenylate-forming protein